MNRILFVDNDPDFLETRAEFLERAGFHVSKSTNLSDAEKHLRDGWFHLAIFDIRMVNDDDEKDVSGMTLINADFIRTLTKIVLTSFNTSLVRDLVRAAQRAQLLTIDVIEKAEGPDALIAAVNVAFAKHVRINWNLTIDWKARDSFSLVKLIEPNLEGERLLNRAEELEDLFRRLFYEKGHIRVERLLWRQNSRVALVVFAFKEGLKPEAFVVVCGQNAIINDEAQHFYEFAPKAPGETGTALSDKMRVETTHFAANAYTLAGNDLEHVQTLAELYRLGPEKTFNAALNTLFQQNLEAWHQEKHIFREVLSLDIAYRRRLRLIDEYTQQLLEERIAAVEAQIPTLGASIERSEEMLLVRFNGQSFAYSNPLTLLSQAFRTRQSALSVTVPGTLSGDNILTDTSGHTWLTDFAEAGLAPLVWNYVTLEAAIRFDWVETKELQRRHELERCLSFTDFAKPDIRDLEQVVLRPARAIRVIRKMAARPVGRDTDAYYLGIFFHAARRLMDFNPAFPLPTTEWARLGHILLSMAMIAERLKLELADEPPLTPQPISEVSIKDEKARIIMIGDREKRLPPQPFAVFWYLYCHANVVCNKEDIMDAALIREYGESYLHTLIGRIRKVIEDDPEQPLYLITEHNAGYRLVPKPE